MVHPKSWLPMANKLFSFMHFRTYIQNGVTTTFGVGSLEAHLIDPVKVTILTISCTECHWMLVNKEI